MPSAIRFNLEQSKVLSSGNGLNIGIMWYGVSAMCDSLIFFFLRSILYPPTPYPHFLMATLRLIDRLCGV